MTFIGDFIFPVSFPFVFPFMNKFNSQFQILFLPNRDETVDKSHTPLKDI